MWGDQVTLPTDRSFVPNAIGAAVRPIAGKPGSHLDRMTSGHV
ncbi:hypothetical protein RK21_03868 [Pseudomonas plecoglossicida]|nr:hypothetical protein RK21_03868 [Pseudomonas plecoglossicida]